MDRLTVIRSSLAWVPPSLVLGLALFATLRRPASLEQPVPLRSVVDARGLAVPLPQDSQGIVLAAPMVGEYLMNTQEPDSLLSLHPMNRQMVQSSPLARIFPKLPGLRTDLAETLNPEQLLLSKPRAIIPWGPAPETLKTAGLPIVELKTLRDKDWWIDDARIFGEMAGRPGRGLEMKQSFDEAIALLRAEGAAFAGEAAPTVLEVSPGPDGTLRHSGVSFQQDEWQDLAGGRNAIQGGGVGRIDMERLYRADPEILILSRLAALSPLQVMQHPLWQGLRAVRDRRVYRRPPGMVFTTSGIVEYPLYVRWLGELLHPVTLEPRLREIMRAAYQRELRYPMNEQDLDQLLAVPDNRFSLYYERFEAAHDP